MRFPAASRVGKYAMTYRIALIGGALGVGILTVLAYTLLHDRRVPGAVLSKLTVTVPMQIVSAPMLVASRQGLFRAEGVAVTVQPFQIGKDALKSVLEGHANLALEPLRH
jgi:ABC-type nitrate/sulfonate/bicarbonate transport system substrate-binding protein